MTTFEKTLNILAGMMLTKHHIDQRNLKSKNLKKKNGFAIIIDDEGSDRLYVKKLARLVKKLNLESAPRELRDKVLSSAQPKNVVFFGLNNNFDYTVIEGNLEELRRYKMKNVYRLTKDYNEIVRALDRYISSNYDDCCEDLEIEIEITVEDEQPKRKVRKNKKKKVYDVVEIYDRFVRIGFDVYEIYNYKNNSKDYVEIEGEEFVIKTDIFGRKYLA